MSSSSKRAPERVRSLDAIKNQEFLNRIYNRSLETGETAAHSAAVLRKEGGSQDMSLDYAAEDLIQQMVDKRKKQITKNKRLSFSDAVNASLTSTAPTNTTTGSLTGGTSA